ncbi:SRPBCC family protein [Luteimonas sp. SX5]|uniref:SRPBCC family protein n=1 Tax=Luteimonas galliterrae TaxID=2940486 RepID=A0ABT0MJ24_9GAMM|nr:SRPBCC family protein [Luteimonas galliterrae]MCL1634285.1 SRPBCC family protein [Luteimonas galliterrae]
MANKENTVRLHRVFAAPPERVYKAFLDAAALCKWLPPNGFTCTVHEIDAKVGGKYKMSFTNFSTGNSHGFGGEYLELVPNEKIVHTDSFDDPNLPGVMVTTIVLKKVSVGTEVHITQENLPDAIPVEGCYLGWQDSLNLLALVVTPEIPDN